jgi:hypothetical protein
MKGESLFRNATGMSFPGQDADLAAHSQRRSA